MDDFGLDRQELTGALISLEFGPGGRIQQLWASDPSAPEDSEEFQFVAPPLAIGEESTEDYYPGTILLGARTHPDDPWIVSRNSRAEMVDDGEEGVAVKFEYEFSFLDELLATGRYYEIPGVVPQIAWDVEIKNQSRRSIEIGELGFPFALNNILEGFDTTDRGIRELWNDRVYVHKFIGASASYLFAQRMTAQPPGLAIFPGGDTSWEFYNHIPASLVTNYRWEGIPVAYVYSQAAVEREGWQEWFRGHTSLVLEPGEGRIYRTRFAPADRHLSDNLARTLATCERPALRVFPAAVAPVDVGIAVEVAGATPTKFSTDVEMEIETDSDEEGGFCFLRPSKPGAVKLSFDDTKDRRSETHLLFTEPIAELIQKRAIWIENHQVCLEPGSLENAIVPAEIESGSRITDPDSFADSFGIECGLADALFLAEKNVIYPSDSQVEVLDSYLSGFVENVLQNPLDSSVGSAFPDLRSVAVNFGRPQTYPLLGNLYHSMARLGKIHSITRNEPPDYLKRATKTWVAMFANANEALMDESGIPLMSYLPELIRDLREEGLKAEADHLSKLLDRRESQLSRRRYPFLSDGQLSGTAYEEAFAVARRRGNDELEERTLRCAFAARSLSTNWWWYGSDKRSFDEIDHGNPGAFDKGELCLSGSTVANSLMFFKTLSRDYSHLPDAMMRLAFGGMLGIWALVRTDGAASMAFCPDLASKQFGMAQVTGDVGIGLFHYLRGVSAYVLPSRASGVVTFGCHFEVESDSGSDVFVVRPWDGVGRRIVVRQFGFEVSVEGGQLTEVRVDSRKRHAILTIRNMSDRELSARLQIKGMWGNVFAVDGNEVLAENGTLNVSIFLPGAGTVRSEITVKK